MPPNDRVTPKSWLHGLVTSGKASVKSAFRATSSGCRSIDKEGVFHFSFMNGSPDEALLVASVYSVPGGVFVMVKLGLRRIEIR